MTCEQVMSILSLTWKEGYTHLKCLILHRGVEHFSELSNFLLEARMSCLIYSDMFDFLTIDASLSNIKRQALSILWKKPLVSSSLQFRLLNIKSRTTTFWKINYMLHQYIDLIHNRKYSNVYITLSRTTSPFPNTEKNKCLLYLHIDKRICCIYHSFIY